MTDPSVPEVSEEIREYAASLSDEEARALAIELAIEQVHEWDRERCREHPAHLLRHVRCLDSETTEEFEFQLWRAEDGSVPPWFWQRSLLDWWIDNPKTVCLKARQLGVTWLAGGYALWHLLFRPGSRVLIYSIKETEAVKVVNRIWDMLQSLPEHLRAVEVIKPGRDVRPSNEIQVKHPDGKVSTVLAQTATRTSGHGETAALVILDEFSRQEYASEVWKAALPTAAKGGRLVVISTGNGVAKTDAEGEFAGGNYFYHLWTHAKELGVATRFLRWDVHPDRDDRWYESNAMALPAADRGEQYPRNEHEAFILTGHPFFDLEGLEHYGALGEPVPLFEGRFRPVGRPDRAVFSRAERSAASDDPGCVVRVWQEPVVGRKYGVACDIASGSGMDFSSAHVLDLEAFEIAAVLHGRLDQDLLAYQLHFLGRWFNNAVVAPEVGGGWGEAVILSLRDGRDGRPPYPNVYLHKDEGRTNRPLRQAYGFPMTSKTRPVVLGGLERVVREQSLPWIDAGTLFECQTFVHRDTQPSPRASDGCNDDRVMSLGIAVDLFRQRGVLPVSRQRPVDSGSSDFESMVGVGRG